MKAYVLYAKTLSGPMNWLPAEKSAPPVKTLKGFLQFHVKIQGFDFKFRTLEEIEYCIEVLSQKNLDTDLTYRRNSSWLSRLPAWTKSWKYRQKAVAGFAEALKMFRKDPEGMVAGKDPKDKADAKFKRKVLPSRLKLRSRKKAEPSRST